MGATGVRRGHGGGREGNVPSEKGTPSQFVSHTHGWPHAKCLPVAPQKVNTLFSQEKQLVKYLYFCFV